MASIGSMLLDMTCATQNHKVFWLCCLYVLFLACCPTPNTRGPLNQESFPGSIRESRAYPPRCVGPLGLPLPVIGVPLGPWKSEFPGNNSALPFTTLLHP